MGVYLALSARILVNLESLNMAESVGNVTKHRKAPVVYQDGGTYRVVYVPVISGMSLAHHYQVLLARAASKRGLPVSNLSLQGYFLKYADDEIIERYYYNVWNDINEAKKSKEDKRLCDIEKIIVVNDVVADVGGFLYTGGPVKRTSRFSFSYMVPALDAIKAAAVYPQLHVRYSPRPGTEGEESGREAAAEEIGRRREQVPIYIDNASALYTVSYILEASEVSVFNICKAMSREQGGVQKECKEQGKCRGQEVHELDQLKENEKKVKHDSKKERVEAAIEALVAMFGNMAFGAKRSRSLPHWKVMSIVVVGSRGIAPFVPTPGHDVGYLESTLKRLEAQKQVIKGFEAVVHYYAVEELKGDVKGAVRHDTPEKAIWEAAKWVIERLGGQNSKGSR